MELRCLFIIFIIIIIITAEIKTQQRHDVPGNL